MITRTGLNLVSIFLILISFEKILFKNPFKIKASNKKLYSDKGGYKIITSILLFFIE